MMHAILIFITAIYYTLPELMTASTVINRLIIISPALRVKEKRERIQAPLKNNESCVTVFCH